MALHDQIQTAGRAPTPPSRTLDRDGTVWAPAKGVYLTDETSLFRVEDIIFHRHELLLELEDCSTFELILCPARKPAHVALRAVAPTA